MVSSAIVPSFLVSLKSSEEPTGVKPLALTATLNLLRAFPFASTKTRRMLSAVVPSALYVIFKSWNCCVTGFASA